MPLQDYSWAGLFTEAPVRIEGAEAISRDRRAALKC